MTVLKNITQEELNYLKSRWALDGNTLVWKNGRRKGSPVSVSCRHSGHQNVYMHYNEKLRGYVLARIIWFLRTGEYPDLFVEHKDGNPQNNSVENLRLATQSQNMANTKIGRTGNEKKGVYYDKRVNKYYTQVQKEGKVYSKTGFTSFDDAYAARQSLAHSLFGEFAR
jgi:HNH endonuclease